MRIVVTRWCCGPYEWSFGINVKTGLHKTPHILHPNFCCELVPSVSLLYLYSITSAIIMSGGRIKSVDSY